MKPIVIGALVGTALCGTALAQTKAAPDTDIGGRSGTLSDKLNDTGGVIHPQDSVDPKIQRTAPSTGAMPVIPPPGSPGGRNDVQPK